MLTDKPLSDPLDNIVTLAGAAVGLVSALIGFVGIVRENRIWLSIYTVLLWPVFCLYVSVGYIAFRRSKNHLRNHLRDEWIHDYTRDQRLLVQRNVSVFFPLCIVLWGPAILFSFLFTVPVSSNQPTFCFSLACDIQLKCCGYLSPIQNGEYDLRCFPMINLPGCIHKYNLFEDKLLTTVWTASFSLVPLQLFVMIAALLCSNHVDGMLRSGRPGLKNFKEQ